MEQWNNFPRETPRLNSPIKIIVANPYTGEKRLIISTFRSTGRFDGVCEGIDIVEKWTYIHETNN